MADCIAICSQKGGVGKTTVALNLSLALAERGHRTLVVDLDAQGGIGLSLAQGDTELEGLAELLMGQLEPDAALCPTKVDTLSLLPRGRLDPADTCEYEHALYVDRALDHALEFYRDDFALIILDTPSGTGMVTRAALRFADYVLVPSQAQALALRSVGQILRVIEQVREKENPHLTLLGILPTFADKSEDASLSTLVEMWSGLAGLTETTIPRNEVFTRASAEGVPLKFLGGPPSPEARRFDLLAAELEGRLADHHPEAAAVVAREKRQLL